MELRFWVSHLLICGREYHFGGPDNFFNADALYLQIPNDNPGTYYSTLPYGPTATEDGLVWLKTGSGSPTLYDNPDLAVSVYYENTSSAWQLEETMFSTGGYSGDFLATATPTEGESRVISNPLIVSSETIPVIDLSGHPNETFQQGLFYLQFRTDPALENTGKMPTPHTPKLYAASVTGALGVYVAQTAPFKVDFGLGSGLLYANELGMYMPAAVLKTGAFPGDANGDGTVDINDLTIVLSHFGETGCVWSQGCMDGDPTGTVDVNYLTIVLTNFGHTAGASAGGIAAVAEPSALLLTGAGLLGLLATRVGGDALRRHAKIS